MNGYIRKKTFKRNIRAAGITGALLIALLCAVFFLAPIHGASAAFAPARAEAEAKSGFSGIDGADAAALGTVKVGLPIIYGFFGLGDNGDYYGYDYEFLMELAQYTGIDFEVVPYNFVSNADVFRYIGDLEAGVIQLGSGMGATKAGSYELIEPNYADIYGAVAAGTDSPLTQYNYYKKPDLKVAVFGTRHLGYLQNLFANTYHSTFEVVSCNSAQEQVDAVNSGAADVLLTLNTDVLVQDNWLKILDKFNPNQVFFAVTPDRTDLAAMISEALNKIIGSGRLDFEKLEKKYFPSATQELVFSDEELAYIAQNPSLKVMLPYNAEVLAGYDEKSKAFRGINVEIMELISARTGIEFSYILPKSYGGLLSSLQSGEAHLASGLTYDYELAKLFNVNLTQPYASMPLGFLSKDKNATMDMSGKRIAVPSQVTLPEVWAQRNTVLTLDSEKECFDAVNKKQADFAFGNAYILQYLILASGSGDMRLMTAVDQQQEVCIGVTKPADIQLISIVNKALHSIPSTEIQSVIMKNVFSVEITVSFGDFVKANLPAFIITIVVIIVGAAAAVIVYYAVKYRKRAEYAKQEGEAYRRRAELDGLTQIYNAMTFKQRLEQRYANEGERGGALMILDIDNFKHINDSNGHIVGDSILKALGATLQAICGQADICGRYGGDEFVLYLGEADENSAQECCERINKLFLASEANKSLGVTLSIGICFYKDSDDLSDLYLKADSALYKAKRNGKKQTVIFQNGLFSGRTN